MRVVGVACLAGLALAFAVSRGLSTMLYGVSPTDPLTILSMIGVLLFVAALAAWIPTGRAISVDPVAALRTD
jgi:ABC-type antimicrobial peptide transport system permease subunit